VKTQIGRGGLLKKFKILHQLKRAFAGTISGILFIALLVPLQSASATSEYVRDVGSYPTFKQQQVSDSYLEDVYPDAFDLATLDVRWSKFGTSDITIRYSTHGVIDSDTYKLKSMAQIYLDVNLDGVEDHWLSIGDDLWGSLILKGSSTTSLKTSSTNSTKCEVTQQLARSTFRHVDVTIPLSCLDFQKQIGVRMVTNFGYGAGGIDEIPNRDTAYGDKFAVFDTPLSPESTVYLPSAMKIEIEAPEQVLQAGTTEIKIKVTNIAGEPLSGVHLEMDAKNASILPRMAVTNDDGYFIGRLYPSMFDYRILVAAKYGSALAFAAIEAVNYAMPVYAYQSPDSGMTFCFTDAFNYDDVEKFGITGVRFNVERNKSGKWEKFEIDLPIPLPGEKEYMSTWTEFGRHGALIHEGLPKLIFEINSAKAGETIKCATSLLIGSIVNLPDYSDIVATQDGPHSVGIKPAFEVEQKTLAKFSSSATTLTTQQKSQVKAAVEANPNATKFICTGIRYVSQPLSENIKVRKRAKAACDYAKTLNPQLSTWYQNKPTEARSYAGKVLLTIKSPAN